MRRFLLAALVVALAAPAALAGNRIKLRNGNVIDGVVEKRTVRAVIVRTKKGLVHVPAGEVVSIARIRDRPEVIVASVAPATLAAVAMDPGPETAAREPKDSAGLSDHDVKRLLRQLGSRSVKDRAEASEEIIAKWPATAGVVEQALMGRIENARMTAVHLLARKELGDTSEFVRIAVNSPSARVRLVAAQQIRRGGLEQLEGELVVRVLVNDPDWSVKLEALRGLERIGTMRCAKVVLYSFRTSKKPRWRKKCLRVLRRITGHDHGENVRAWENAVDWLNRTGGGKQPPPPPTAE